MIRVNLLPKGEIETYAGIKQEVSIVLLSYMLMGLLILYLSMSVNTQQKRLKAKLNVLNLEINKYKDVEKKIAEYKKQKKVIQQKIKVISNLKRDRKRPLLILNALTSNFLTGKMWFEELTIKGNNLDIKGIALSNESIAEFMKRLKKTALFKRVDLIKTEKRKVQTYELTGFELKGSIALNKNKANNLEK